MSVCLYVRMYVRMSPKFLEIFKNHIRMAGGARERPGDTLWRPPEGVAIRGCGVEGV